MKIYIDIPNLLSVIHSAKNEKYADCMRMLKDNFSIIFTFEKNDIKDLEQFDRQDVLQWLTQMSTGIRKDNTESMKWGSTFPTRPLDIASFKQEQLTSVYCLSKENDSKLESIANKGNLLIAIEGQEIETLSSLFLESYQYTKNIFHS